MANRKREEEKDAVESAEDRFIRLVQEALEAALLLPADIKEKNGLYANCIKFIAVKNRLKGDTIGNWAEDD